MRTFSVKNFERFQHYKDRSPPWIKLYNSTLSDYAFCRLQDASKAHLLAIWLLASRSDNKLPYDPVWIAQQISATQPVDLDLLVSGGFIVLDQPLRSPEQNASKPLALARSREGETETETETEKRVGNGVNGTLISVAAPAGDPPPPDDLDAALMAYQATAKQCRLPEVKNFSRDRRAKLRARLNEHGIARWHEALALLARSDFLRGDNARGWRADFDFLLQPKSFNRLMEGGYENREHSGNGRDVSKPRRPTAPPPAYGGEGEGEEPGPGAH